MTYFLAHSELADIHGQSFSQLLVIDPPDIRRSKDNHSTSMLTLRMAVFDTHKIVYHRIVTFSNQTGSDNEVHAPASTCERRALRITRLHIVRFRTTLVFFPFRCTFSLR